MSAEKVTMTEEEWNKAIDDHLEDDKKLVGKERVLGPEVESLMALGVERDNLVTERIISRYARGCMGDVDPLYNDPGYGKYTRWGSMIAPPTFAMAIGGPPYYINNIRVPGAVFMHKGSTYVHHKPIRPGDRIRFTQRYLGYQEKQVKNKPYRLFTTEIEMPGYNQRDELVVEVNRGQIITATYPGMGSDITSKGAKMMYQEREKRHYYSDDELEEIRSFYEDELAGKHRRGKEIRYWEDTNEGDAVTPLIEGPLKTHDILAYWAGRGGAMGRGAFAAKWEIDRLIPPEHRLIDPEDGELIYEGAALHANDRQARLLGFPRAVADGYFSDASFAHMVANWMGDDGWLKRMETQNRGMRFTGDMAKFQGTVVKKYIDGDEHLVDLELKSEITNASNALQSKAVATVRLVARNR